jgi:hypothetical protein
MSNSTTNLDIPGNHGPYCEIEFADQNCAMLDENGKKVWTPASIRARESEYGKAFIAQREALARA